MKLNNFSVRVISEPKSRRLNIIFDGVDTAAESLITALFNAALHQEIPVENAEGLVPNPDTRENTVSEQVEAALSTEPVSAPEPASEPEETKAETAPEPSAPAAQPSASASGAEQKKEPARKSNLDEIPKEQRIYLSKVNYQNKDKAKKLGKEAGGLVVFEQETKRWWATSEAVADKLRENGLA